MFSKDNALTACPVGRVVKAIDLKSIGLCPRRFKSCTGREFFFFIFGFFFCNATRYRYDGASRQEHLLLPLKFRKIKN